MSSSEPPAPPLLSDESAAPQDEEPSEEADLDKLKETEAAVMSLLASEADETSASDEGQTLVAVTEPYIGEGDSDEFPAKVASSRASPQNNDAGLVEATPGEVTVKLTTEGLSSLVSYSSSSAEVSASEDNTQDVPEKSNSEDPLTSGKSIADNVKEPAAISQVLEETEENQHEKSQVSPGEVLAAAADALASAVDEVQVEAEEVAAIESVTAALAQAEADLAMKTAEDDVDAAESDIPEAVGSEEEEAASVPNSVVKEDSNATSPPDTKVGESSTEHIQSAQESKDAVETPPNVMEAVTQEALVSAFDEETQAAQEKKDEVNLPKDSLEEAEEALTFVKDSSNQKSPKEMEKVTFKDIVQTSVADENSDVKMDTDTKEVPEKLPTEHPSTKIDTTQSAKSTAEDADADTTEESKITIDKEVNSGKGIKRPLEDDTEEPAEDKKKEEEGRGKRPKKSEPAIESSLHPLEQEEAQDTPQEEETELMETGTTRDLEPESGIKTRKRVEPEGLEKGDEGSRDGEGDEVGEDDAEKKDNSGQDKDKDDSKEDEESSTPSRRRKKKRRAYERPRGEGGKFMKEKPDPSMLDEETRMDCSLLQDEDSQGSASRREVRRFRCEVIVPESTEVFTADKVVEYVWPLEGIGEHYFIQEQISQYLGIMSFKRRYPDLRRRPIDMQERDYLKEKGLVSDMACDLGLTAVRSEDVLDVMFNDFPAKFEELQRLLRERKENEMRERGKVNYSMANIDKSKMQEYGRKAAADAARWNASFNKEKREDRRYSFDLQTFTLQMPLGRGKKLPPEMTKIGFYPVAVLPGQFTNSYREYTPQALKTMPLNTVVSAPVVPDPLGSDGNSSDSEEETNDTTQRSVVDDPVKEEKGGEAGPRCKVCSGTKNRNKGGKPEPLIICGNCKSASHPTCIDLTLVMVPKIESYNWQCMDCKSCVTCNDPDDEDKMIFCDMCDRGYHIYCVGLRRVPNGRWHCKECAMCSSCGSKTPAGNEHLKNAEWQHEFKKDKDNKQLRYATTLCVPCDKYWKRRQFCYVCLKVYRSIPEDGMVRCSNCPKYIHREGTCSTMYESERFCINCFKMRNSTALNHSRIIAAAKKKMASGY